MAGTRQHFLPRFLLAGFESRRSGDEVYTYVFQQGTEGSERNTKNVAVERHFYGADSPGGIDDAQTRKEAAFADLVREIRKTSGVPPRGKALVAEFVANLAVRTRHIRDVMGSFARGASDTLRERFARPDLLYKDIQAHIRRKPDETLAPLLERLGIKRFRDLTPRERMALLSFVEKTLRDEAPNLSLMVDPAFDHANKSIFSKDWAKEVHVKTLQTAVVPLPRLEFLAKLEWSVSVGPPGTFILGDLVVIRYSPKSGQFESSLEMKGKKRAILVPLSDRHLLVGHRKGIRLHLDYEALNRATADLCADFFVSSRNTRREVEYAFSLGASCDQIWKETLAETERESLAHPRVTSRTPATFPPCIADPVDPLPSLQRCVGIVAERVAAAQPVYFNSQMKGWIKRKMWTANISCEVQRPTAIPDTIGVVTARPFAPLGTSRSPSAAYYSRY